MITPANPIFIATVAGSLLYPGAVTPVCTVEARRDEEDESAEVTEPEVPQATMYLSSQIKTIDIVIAIESLHLNRMTFSECKRSTTAQVVPYSRTIAWFAIFATSDRENRTSFTDRKKSGRLENRSIIYNANNAGYCICWIHQLPLTSYYGYRRYFLMLIDMDRRKMLL